MNTPKIATPQGGVFPLVSVVTPCYNAAPFVAETIESVLAQTHPSVEHVVVDDGSTDESWAAVAPYAEAGRVRAVRLPGNRGGSHARNRGAALARGEYLMFLDADDVLAPTAIETLAAAIRDEPGAIAMGRWERLRQVAGRWTSAPAEVPFPPPADALYGWLDGVWVPPCAVLWRRDAYARAGGWDETLAVNQDGDITMRALILGVRVVIAGGATVAWYRAHAEGRTGVSTGSYSRAWLESQIRVHEEVATALEDRGVAAAYAGPIGRTYRHFGSVAAVNGHHDLAGLCLRRAERYLGPSAAARTRLGRLLSIALGVQRKEQLAMVLARWGFMSKARRDLTDRHRARGRVANATRHYDGAEG
jgi:O-antigen biosynthesis protein